MAKGAGRPAFVGRGIELGQLDDAFEGALAGIPVAVVLLGEAGIGKSRLIDEFAAHATEAGALVLSGSCLPLSAGSVPFLPFTAALRSLVKSIPAAELRAVLGPARAELARLVPELAKESHERPAPGEGHLARARLFELFLGAAERLAARAPVVLVLEDLQWADRATLDLLVFLVSSVVSGRVLLLASCRTVAPGDEPPVLALLAELERRPNVRRLELERLSREEVAAQVRALVGRQVAAGELDEVADRSGGNPFFVEQLVLAGFPSLGGSHDGPLPSRLREVLRARIEPLSPPAREILEIVAVCGGLVREPVLARVIAPPEGTGNEGLREAVDAGVLLRLARDPDEPELFGFDHGLLQEFIHGELLPGERRSLHARCAAALAPETTVDPNAIVEIAHHWYAAGDPERALPACVEAAARSEALFAFAEADLQYGRALELWSHVPFADDRVGIDHSTLLERGAEVAALDGDGLRAAALIREALTETDVADDERRSSYLHGRLRVYLWQSGQLDAATADAEAALRSLPVEHATPERARALAHLAALRMEQGKFERSREIADEALDVARAAGASAEEGLALGTLGLDLIELGQTTQGIGRLREAWQRSLELGGALGIGLAYGNLTAALDRVGRYQEAIEIGEEGMRAARRVGLQRSYVPLVAGHLADALTRVGRWDEARALCRDALDGSEAGPMTVHVRLMETRLALRSGDLGMAASGLAAALDAGTLVAGDELVTGLAVRIELALASGGGALIPVADVLNAADSARGWRPALGDLLTLALRAQADASERARVSRDKGAVRAAQRASRRLMDRLRRLSALTANALAPDAQPYLLLGRAEATRAANRDARAAWAEAKSAWSERGDPYTAAYAALRETEALLAGGRDRIEAEKILSQAHRLALPLGAVPLIGEIEALARRARLSLPAEAAEPAERHELEVTASPDAAADLGLTPREREILGYLAAGWSNREIGEALFISPKTASVHVSNILGKLGVQGRVQAAAVAHRLGLADAVSDPPGSRV